MDYQSLRNFVYGGAEEEGEEAVGSRKRPSPWSGPAVLPLPLPLVEALEALFEGEAAPELFAPWLESCRRELAQLRETPLHGGEIRALEQASEQLHNLESRLSQGDLPQAVEAAFRWRQALYRYARQRESNRQCRLDEVNNLVLAGLSFLEGHAARWEIMDPHRARAAQELGELVDLYRAVEPVLPPEVRGALLTGIQRVTEGLRALEHAPQGDQLREALRSLVQGAELLHLLREWRGAEDAALAGPLPLAGKFLREAALGVEWSEDRVRDWEQSLWPALLDFWQQTRERLLLPARARQLLVERIDAELEGLQDAVELPPDELSTVLATLEECFEHLANEQWDLSVLDDQPDRWQADLALAVVAGGVPAFTLAETAETLAPEGSESLRQALADYLDTGSHDPLLGFLEDWLQERQGARSGHP